MRKGFDGLSGLVSTELGSDPLSGDVFLFVNRRRDRIKLLVWDRSGYMIFYKRLESGTFELPDSDADSIELQWREMVMILEGVELKSIRNRTRFSLEKN